MKDKLDNLILSIMTCALFAAFFIAGYDYNKLERCEKIEGATYVVDLGMCLKIKRDK